MADRDLVNTARQLGTETGSHPVPTENANEGTAAGVLGVAHLRRFWSRVLAGRHGQPVKKDQQEWLFDQILLSGLGLALEETLQYLYQEGPSLAEFEKWILERNNGRIAQPRLDRINRALGGLTPAPSQQAVIEAIDNAEAILTAEHLRFWDHNGYVIVRGAISKEDARAAAEAVWQRLGMDPSEPETWYRNQGNHGIMVQFFHHPALQRNRESPRIHKAFAQLWGTADLWVTTDRVSFNPPERPGWLFSGPRLHWDTSLALPIPFGVQGLLYLTDTAPDQGAFTCVPGFHRRIAEWLESLPPGADPRVQDLDGLGAIPIAAEAGDLIIWHHALPHGSRPNRAKHPRMVQYITMFPAVGAPEREWR